jgi:Kef-type K+ transport system membrane component KefB/Trk K+ transport system NAD-binding subunit
MEQTVTFLPLLIVLLLTFLVPLIFHRVRWMSLVVGEILVGILIGRSGLKIVQIDPTLDFLAEIGLSILMFLSGLEIDFNLLFQVTSAPKRRLKPLVAAAASFGLTVVLAAAAGRALHARGLSSDPWMIALILSTTSLGIVVPVLKERGMSATPYGQSLLFAALLADFFTMLLITVYVTLRSRGLTLEILFVTILFVAALLVYRVGLVRLRRDPAQKVIGELQSASSQVKVHGAIALLIGFTLLAKFLGSEMILGAFLAGAVLSLLSRPGDEQTRARLEAIGFGFFIPLFFFTVGIRFDLPSLLSNRRSLILTPVILGAALLIKLLASLIFRIFCSWRETLAAGLILSARLSLIIAAAGIGRRLGVIDEATNAAFILVAALTSTLSPLGFNGLLPRREAHNDWHVLLFGANDLAFQVGHDLRKHGERAVFIETDPGAAERARREGFEVILAGEMESRLRAINPEFVRSFMALGPDDAQNLSVCLQALALSIPSVISLVHNAHRLQDFTSKGIQPFIPGLYRAAMLSLMARNPDLFNLIVSEREEHQIREIGLSNPALVGKPLRSLRLGGDVLVLSIRRMEEFIVPHGSTILEAGDRLIFLGGEEAFEEIEGYLAGARYGS